MSRIAGLHRPLDSRPAADRDAVRRMLHRYDGDVELLEGPQGAIGRVSRPEGATNGDAAHGEGLSVAIDGRILNSAELRRSLPVVAPGDAALIAALVRRHGVTDTLPRLSGDFAIAVLDPAAGRLWLVRDRFGVKPMYWTEVAGGIAFASQPRSLLSLADVSADPDPSFVARFAASHYRTFDNDPAASPFRAIHQLPAAHVMEVAANGTVSSGRYWALTNEPDFAQPEAELAEIYRAHLLRAVGERTRLLDRPIFSLSGGLDSSSVLCSAESVSGRRQQAISCLYTDATYDERNEIRDVVDAKVEKWHTVELGNSIELGAIVARLVRLHDEPVATATWLSHLLMMERTAELGRDALFGGLGGDELNAGEYEYFPMHFADLRAAGQSDMLAHEIACWAGHHDHPIHRKNSVTATAMMDRLTDPSTPGLCRPDFGRMLRYRRTLNRDYFPLQSFVPIMDRPFDSYLKNRAYQDMFRETLPCCLRAQDRHSAAFGISCINPFLDHALVEFMFRVGGTMKIRDGITKRLLREATVGILPDATRERIKKTGWNAPAHVWFSDRTLDDLRDRVRSEKFRSRGIYDPDAVLTLIEDHVRIVDTAAVEDNHMMFLWQLLNLESWLDALPEISGATGSW